MKILHIITGLSSGGAERALFNLLSGGLAKESQHAVISLQGEGIYGACIRDMGVPVYCLDLRGSVPTLGALAQLCKTVREIEPKVIQGWMYHGNLAAYLATRFLTSRPKLVWNIRQCLYTLSIEKLMTRQVIRLNRHFSSRVDAIIYNSHLSRKQHENFGFDDAHSQVIPNGFDMTVFGQDASIRARIRSEFGITDSALVIGHVARFHPVKDHVSFLQAAVLLASENALLHFLVIGRDVSLNNPDLSGIVPVDLLSRFHFPGERMDVADLMRAMDVFCLSSKSEAFPNVLGEAMATGLPCLTTDVGECASVVAGTGVVVPPKSLNALADGLSALLSMSKESRFALGAMARERIRCHYSLPTIIESYSELYRGLLADSGYS